MGTTMTWTTEAKNGRTLHSTTTADGTLVVVHENIDAGTVAVTTDDPLDGAGVVAFGPNFATVDEAKAVVAALLDNPAIECFEFNGSHVRVYLAVGFWIDGRRTDYACQASAIAGVLEHRLTEIEQ
jgi:hypothetical protein